jgi:hypothetical protein
MGEEAEQGAIVSPLPGGEEVEQGVFVSPLPGGEEITPVRLGPKRQVRAMKNA